MKNFASWAAGHRTGPIRRFRKLAWYACEGLIALHDEADPDMTFRVFTPAEFHERAEKGLVAFAKKVPRTGATPWQRQESVEMLNAAQQMKESVNEAIEMGDPSDPKVQAFWSRHRRSSTISMSAGCRWEQGAPKKTLDQIAKDSPGDKTLSAITGNEEIIRQLPKKRPRPGALILDL